MQFSEISCRPVIGFGAWSFEFDLMTVVVSTGLLQLQTVLLSLTHDERFYHILNVFTFVFTFFYILNN